MAFGRTGVHICIQTHASLDMQEIDRLAFSPPRLAIVSVSHSLPTQLIEAIHQTRTPMKWYCFYQMGWETVTDGHDGKSGGD